MQIQISIPQWLSIDQKVRLKLVEVFELPRTGYTHVQDGVVTTDGYKHEDLAHLTVAKMQDYINNHKEEDFFKLLDRTLNQATRQVRGDEILNDGKPPDRLLWQSSLLKLMGNGTHLRQRTNHQKTTLSLQ